MEAAGEGPGAELGGMAGDKRGAEEGSLGAYAPGDKRPRRASQKADQQAFVAELARAVARAAPAEPNALIPVGKTKLFSIITDLFAGGVVPGKTTFWRAFCTTLGAEQGQKKLNGATSKIMVLRGAEYRDVNDPQEKAAMLAALGQLAANHPMKLHEDALGNLKTRVMEDIQALSDAAAQSAAKKAARTAKAKPVGAVAPPKLAPVPPALGGGLPRPPPMTPAPAAASGSANGAALPKAGTGQPAPSTSDTSAVAAIKAAMAAQEERYTEELRKLHAMVADQGTRMQAMQAQVSAIYAAVGAMTGVPMQPSGAANP